MRLGLDCTTGGWESTWKTDHLYRQGTVDLLESVEHQNLTVHIRSAWEGWGMGGPRTAD